MATTVKHMIEEANAVVPRISPEQARRLVESGNVLLVDVRDAPEVEATGIAKGAIHVSRGMLEFRADPESPMHRKEFMRDRPIILYCASGGRAALAGKTLRDLGFREVYNMGAFKDWVEAGGEVERPVEPGM